MTRLLTTLVLLFISLGWTHTVEAKRTNLTTNQAQNAIARASQATGVSHKLLVGFGGAESGFDHRAKSTKSTAVGVFQFTSPTWRKTVATYGKKYGLTKRAKRTDPYANALMAGEYIKENKRYLRANLRRPITQGDLYMAHLISPQKTVMIDAMPGNRRAASVMPLFARKNHNLFYTKSGKARTLSQFKQTVYAKLNRNMSLYGGDDTLRLTMTRVTKPKAARLVVTKNTCDKRDYLDTSKPYTVQVSESVRPVKHRYVVQDSSTAIARAARDAACTTPRRKVV